MSNPSNQDLIRLILTLEDKLRISFPSIDEYIPLIRTFIYQESRLINRADKPTTILLKRKNRLLTLSKGIKAFFHLLFEKSYNRITAAPALHRNVPSDRQLVSKHLDSLLNEFSNNKGSIIETEGLLNDNAIYNDPGWFVSKIAAVIGKLSTNTTEEYAIANEVSRLVTDLSSGFSIDAKKLHKSMKDIRIFAQIYKLIFRIKNIQSGYFIVYYGSHHLAMISALNHLGAETTEYQHGIQNNSHPMYTNFENMQAPSSFLPREIWVWDNVAESRFLKWGQQFGITVKVTGNLWLKSQSIERQPTRSNQVLVALQLFPDHFNFELLTVAKLHPNVEWVFREHPLSTIPDDARIKFFDPIPNVSIQAQGTSLEQTLIESAVCISGFSTVCIEAMNFGLPVIFSHPIALEGLQEYIDEEKCFYADNANDISQVIAKIMAD